MAKNGKVKAIVEAVKKAVRPKPKVSVLAVAHDIIVAARDETHLPPAAEPVAVKRRGISKRCANVGR